MRSYHSFNSWRVLGMDGEDVGNEITFGIELEVTQDRDESNPMYPDDLADIIEERYSGIFICERDGSIGEGVEIISMPMTIAWYRNNKERIRELMELCIENGYAGEKGNLCGLHVHFGRKGLGFSDEELAMYPPEKREMIKSRRQREVEENIINLLETFQEQMKRISGRKSYNWCDFVSSGESSVTDIRKECESYYSRSNRGSHGQRYHAVNFTNDKTVEIRIMRSTLNFDTFDSRIMILYSLASLSKSYVGIVGFQGLLSYGLKQGEKEKVRNYVSGNRGIDIDEVKKKVSLNMKNEYRKENLEVRWR